MSKPKKGKIVMIVAIGLMCFILMTIMFMQFKIVNQTDITSIETMRKSELTTELASWKQKYEETNAKFEETQDTLNDYRNSEKSSTESQKLLNEELDKINLILGKTDVEGQGVTITIKDVTEEAATDVSSIKADDLLTIVNALKLAGAEAISVNDQRIVNTSDIVYINNSFIKVNQQRILSPYVIKATGNSAYLESALIGNGGYADELKQLGHDISIQKENRIKINKYEGELDTKYMN